MANMVFGDDPSCGIKKRVLHASKSDLPSFPDGTKVTEELIFFICLDEMFSIIIIFWLCFGLLVPRNETIGIFLNKLKTSMLCSFTMPFILVAISIGKISLCNPHVWWRKDNHRWQQNWWEAIGADLWQEIQTGSLGNLSEVYASTGSRIICCWSISETLFIIV